MARSRAWSVLVASGDREYAGHNGYSDAPREVYKYDSNVRNHKKVSVGDIVLVHDKKRLLGIARVEDVRRQAGRKTIRRCPICGRAGPRRRKHAAHAYRCKKGHEFDEPIIRDEDVIEYEAHYGGSYIDTPDAFSRKALKAAALRFAKQLSIQEVDLARLEAALLTAFPDTGTLLAEFYQGATLGSEEAEEEGSAAAGDGTAPYSISMSDTRKAVERSIKARRGQQKIRAALLQRYSATCVVTGCTLVEVLEAAHIWPYRGVQDNHPENGLLLRADIHTLFDLNLLVIHPSRLTIYLAPALLNMREYAGLQDAALTLKGLPDGRPALEPLRRRWSCFVSKWRQQMGAGGAVSAPTGD